MSKTDEYGKRITCKRCTATAFAPLISRKKPTDSDGYFHEYDVFKNPEGWLLEFDQDQTDIQNNQFGIQHWICPKCLLKVAYDAIERTEGTKRAREYVEWALFNKENE